MRTAKIAETRASESSPPPEVPAGSRSTQSLGKWIDNLMGDSRQRERARKKVRDLMEKSETHQP